MRSLRTPVHYNLEQAAENNQILSGNQLEESFGSKYSIKQPKNKGVFKSLLRKGAFLAAFLSSSNIVYPQTAYAQQSLNSNPENCYVSTICNNDYDCPENLKCLEIPATGEKRCYNSKCEYCEDEDIRQLTGFSFDVNDSLNQACFQHKACYDTHCIEECKWTDTSREFCDNALEDFCGANYNFNSKKENSQAFCDEVTYLQNFSKRDTFVLGQDVSCIQNTSDVINSCPTNNYCDNSEIWQSQCTMIPATQTPTPTPVLVYRTPTPTSVYTNTPQMQRTNTATPTYTPSLEAMIKIGSAIGAPGQQVPIDIFLNVSETTPPIWFNVNEIFFNKYTPVKLNEKGAPDCELNPSLDGFSLIGFTEPDLPQIEGHNRFGMFIFDGNPVYDLPRSKYLNEPTILYTCQFNISPNTPEGSYPLGCGLNVLGLDYIDTTGERELKLVDCIGGEIIVTGGTPTPTRTSTRTKTPTTCPPIISCPGDCNGNERVTIDELVTAVNISLDKLPLFQCKAADRNCDGKVKVNELIAAVNKALNGCKHN